MPVNNTANLVGSYALQTQSILDVFVVQGLVSSADAEKLKRQFKTNASLEQVLLKNRIVTRETINKAYSILLKLPFVSLKNLKIDKDVLNIIPAKTARKYGVVVFDANEQSVKIAVARPAKLTAELPLVLDRVLKEKGLNIDLYITADQDFSEAFNQYRKSSETKLEGVGYPVVYLRNQSITSEALSRLPVAFMKKNRLAVFKKRTDKSYDIAAEDPNNPTVLKTIRAIESQNHIKFQIFAASKEDIDYLISIHPLNNDPKPEAKQAKPVEEVDEKNQIKEEDEPKSEKMEGDEEIISLGGILSSLSGGEKKREEPKITVETKEGVISDEKKSISSDTDKNSKDNKIEEFDDKEEKKEDEELTKKEINKEEEKDNKPYVHQVKDSQIKDESVEINENEISDDSSSKQISKKESADDEDIGSLLNEDVSSKEELVKVIKENFIPKTVAAIIMLALNMRSSDVHVEASDKFLRVRYRIDGILRDVVKLPLKLHPPMISRIKILAKLKLDEARIPQDGRFSVKFKNHEVDVRTSSLPTVHGEKIVMRILDKEQTILSLEDLGMEGRAFDLTAEAVAKPYGVILSTGPTGSGKSTTLYAIINRVSVPSVNIVTLEDPVEYEIPGINQCQVKPGIGFSFAEGLRSVLRQDPNVVMVGEIRDAETANMATHAALTGHLVLSTLHTNDAAGALPRLINMGIEPFLITSSLNLVIAQRLIRRICPKCKREMKVPKSLMEEIQKELDAIPKKSIKDKKRIPTEMKFFHGVGCPDCNQGYKGRVGIFEVLRINTQIEELAVKRMPANELKKAAINDGMITMKQDGILKALSGTTTIDEVFRATSG